MKKILTLFLCLLFHNLLTAQIHEIGVFAGKSNPIGDVGTTDYLAPNEPAFGILYKWNKSPRHAWRFSYSWSTLSGNDLDSDVSGRYERGYSFENSIRELSAGLEFNFFEFNLHESMQHKITPYVFTGLSYFKYDELYVENGITKQDGSSSSAAIPITVGVKSNILKNFIIGFEVGSRYTFTDNLDGNDPKDAKYESLKFGDVNSNDWYVFTGFTLTYTFGNKPCYCAD